MGKIEDLQNVLKVYLTDEDVDYIKEYWKAVYENPSEFENDRVCDMVLSDLKKTPIENWNELNGGKKDMDMEIALLGVPGLKVNHFTPDNTLAWGKFKGSNVVIRQLVGIELPNGTLTMGGHVKYYDSDKFKGPVCILTQSETDSSYIAFYFEHGSIVEDFDENDLVPSGYKCCGMSVLDVFAPEYMSNRYKRFEVLSGLYVPFVNGPNGSIIPVLWKVSKDAIDQQQLNTCVIGEFSYLMRINDAYVHKLMQDIETQFPSVDLDIDKDSRYAYLCIKDDSGNNTYYGYNRNHTAYNGTINDYKALTPILLNVMKDTLTWIDSDNMVQFVFGDIDVSELSIVYSDEPIDPLGILDVNAQVINRQLEKDQKSKPVDKPSEKDDSKMKGSDNPLIRAAQRANTKFE